MIYLLGVGHDIQYGDHPTKSRRFNKSLGQMIEDLGITVLAEEVNGSNFQNPNHWMIVKEQAQNHNIEHIQIEPEIEERTMYGLHEISIIAKCGEILNDDSLTPEQKEPFWKMMNEESEKREQIWFERIKNKRDSNIILIIGRDHISTSPKSRGRGIDTLLTESGWRYVILPLC